MQHTNIQWKAQEYPHSDKSVDWFWAVGITAVAVAVTAIIYGNILFAIFIVIGTFTLLMFAARKPKMVDFELGSRGVRINNTLYPYNTLESFWIHDHENREKKLSLKSEKIIMPYISIPLPDEKVDDVHIFLVEYLPEEEHRESLSEAIMEYLGF